MLPFIHARINGTSVIQMRNTGYILTNERMIAHCFSILMKGGKY